MEMQLNELSEITPQQYLQFVPKQKYNIAKSTIQKVKSTITSLNSGIVTKDFKQTASTPYDFVVGANNMSIIDLSQCYFNIAGELEFPADEPIWPEDLLLGNLFTASLFQNATLELGGAVIAMNANPGIDANMQAALKFDYNDLRNYSLSDREFMIHDFDFDVQFKAEDVKFLTGTIHNASALVNNVAGIYQFKVDKYDANGIANVFSPNSIIYFQVPEDQAITLVTNFNASWVRMYTDDSGIVEMCYAYGTPGADVAQGANSNTALVTLPAAATVVRGRDDKIMNSDKNSVFTQISEPVIIASGNGAVYRLPFRCKLYLSDLFNYTVDSLDYVFNREIKATLTRSAGSNLICNVLTSLGTRKTTIPVASTTKFELIVFSYVLTDTARQQMIQWYSQPIETLFGIQTTNLTPLYTTQANSEQTITLPLTVNYDTKAIILAFPKASNSLVPMSSNVFGALSTAIPANPTDDLVDFAYQMSWYGSNSNSYNYMGIKYIRISNTNNSSIYTYDFQGTSTQVYKPTAFIKSFDINNAGTNEQATILDYRESYEQFKNLRLLFGKSPDNAMDYYTYLKDYCLIPIDLAGTNIPPNTRILVTIQFANWHSPYNPLYYGNVEKNGNQTTTNLLAIFLGSDVLAYNPDGTCVVKHVLSAIPKEKNVNLVN
jgi:hypothetical protein